MITTTLSFPYEFIRTNSEKKFLFIKIKRKMKTINKDEIRTIGIDVQNLDMP